MRVLGAPTNRLADSRLLLPAIDQMLAGQVVLVN